MDRFIWLPVNDGISFFPLLPINPMKHGGAANTDYITRHELRE